MLIRRRKKIERFSLEIWTLREQHWKSVLIFYDSREFMNLQIFYRTRKRKNKCNDLLNYIYHLIERSFLFFCKFYIPHFNFIMCRIPYLLTASTDQFLYYGYIVSHAEWTISSFDPVNSQGSWIATTLSKAADMLSTSILCVWTFSFTRIPKIPKFALK